MSDDEEKLNDIESNKFLSNFKTTSRAISLYGVYKKKVRRSNNIITLFSLNDILKKKKNISLINHFLFVITFLNINKPTRD